MSYGSGKTPAYPSRAPRDTPLRNRATTARSRELSCSIATATLRSIWSYWRRSLAEPCGSSLTSTRRPSVWSLARVKKLAWTRRETTAVVEPVVRRSWEASSPSRQLASSGCDPVDCLEVGRVQVQPRRNGGLEHIAADGRSRAALLDCCR